MRCMPKICLSNGPSGNLMANLINFQLIITYTYRSIWMAPFSIKHVQNAKIAIVKLLSLTSLRREPCFYVKFTTIRSSMSRERIWVVRSSPNRVEDQVVIAHLLQGQMLQEPPFHHPLLCNLSCPRPLLVVVACHRQLLVRETISTSIYMLILIFRRATINWKC